MGKGPLSRKSNTPYTDYDHQFMSKEDNSFLPKELEYPCIRVSGGWFNVNPKTDVGHPELPFEAFQAWIGLLLVHALRSPEMTFVASTRRPEIVRRRMRRLVDPKTLQSELLECVDLFVSHCSQGAMRQIRNTVRRIHASPGDLVSHLWPLPNLYWLLSAENQDGLQKRAGTFLEIPSVVHGLHANPLTGEIDLSPWIGRRLHCKLGCGFITDTWDEAERYHRCPNCKGWLRERESLFDWAVVEGESSYRRRRLEPEWLGRVISQAEGNLPVFFTQWGSYNADGQRVGKKKAGAMWEGRLIQEFPVPFGERRPRYPLKLKPK